MTLLALRPTFSTLRFFTFSLPDATRSFLSSTAGSSLGHVSLLEASSPGRHVVIRSTSWRLSDRGVTSKESGHAL